MGFPCSHNQCCQNVSSRQSEKVRQCTGRELSDCEAVVAVSQKHLRSGHAGLSVHRGHYGYYRPGARSVHLGGFGPTCFQSVPQATVTPAPTAVAIRSGNEFPLREMVVMSMGPKHPRLGSQLEMSRHVLHPPIHKIHKGHCHECRNQHGTCMT